MKTEKGTEELFSQSLKIIENNDVTNDSKGACIIKTSAGSVYCAMLTPENCGLLKGNFVGGNCPTISEEIEIANLQTLGTIEKGIEAKSNDEEIELDRKGNDRDIPYLIVFINKSNRVFTSYRFRFLNSTNWTSWASINIGRTCNLGSLQDCYNTKQWKDLFVIDCLAGQFELEIRTDKNAAGEYFILQSGTYTPDCSKAGGVVSWEE